MSKLLPWLFMFIALLCVTGSVVVPHIPQVSGHPYVPFQGVCSAPPSLLSSLCDQLPVLRRAPELIQRSQTLIESYVPGITSILPDRSPTIDSIIVKAAPRFV